MSATEHVIEPYEEYKVKTGDTLESLAERAGTTWQALARLNFATDEPRLINRALRAQVGCTKRTRGGNYIFTDEDDPGILLVPKPPIELTLATGKSHRIVVKRPDLMGWIEVETVDESGHRIPEVALEIAREGDDGSWNAMTTDGSGYAKLQVHFGRYRVREKTGKRIVYEVGRGRERRVNEAIVDVRNHNVSLTRLVVEREEAAKRQERQSYEKTYVRKPTDESALEGRGEETRGRRTAARIACADNLALLCWADDRSIDVGFLATNVLPDWLRTYHPVIAKRGFYLVVPETSSRRVRLVNQAGKVDGEYHLKEGVVVKGLAGAYTLFEDTHENAFVDMATRTYSIGVANSDGTPLDQDPERAHEIFHWGELLEEADAFHEKVHAYGSRVEIDYLLHSFDEMLWAAIRGGCGYLEEYGSDASLHDEIDARNRDLSRIISQVYEVYVKTHYIPTVKKTENEAALRKLGPPRCLFEMPRPLGATNEQYRALLDCLSTDAELHAWEAIAHRLDHFANRLSQGYPFLRIKPKFKMGPTQVNALGQYVRRGLPQLSEKIPAEVEVEFQIDIQRVDGDVEMIVKSSVTQKIVAKVEGPATQGKTPSGVPVEFSCKKDRSGKVTKSLKLGGYAVDIDDTGKAKLGFEVAGNAFYVDASPRTGEFTAGMTFSGKKLATLLRDRGGRFKRVADIIEGFELQIGVGFVGTRDETILLALTHGPGFFERRAVSELLKTSTLWNDLTLDEQSNLMVLGWDSTGWNSKYLPGSTLPSSVEKKHDVFTSAERIAILHLGFDTYEGYGTAIKDRNIAAKEIGIR